jgi:hypothetical protein
MKDCGNYVKTYSTYKLYNLMLTSREGRFCLFCLLIRSFKLWEERQQD